MKRAEESTSRNALRRVQPENARTGDVFGMAGREEMERDSGGRQRSEMMESETIAERELSQVNFVGKIASQKRTRPARN